MIGRPRIRRGFDALLNIVPGDVVSAMEDMGLDVFRVDDSGEAHCACPAHLENVGHEDRHPSFSVNVDSGLYGCFSCGFHGQFADLAAYVLQIERADAVAWIRSKGTLSRVDRLLARRAPAVDTTTIINEASLALFEPPPWWELAGRQLSAAACDRYGVLWEPKRKLWITPVRDSSGTLLGWQKKNRRYFRNHPQGLKKSKHVFGLQTLPYNSPRAIVVESPLDAVRVASAGIAGAVAAYGKSVSDTQMQLVSERAREVVLFLDNDSPGRVATGDLIRRWGRRGIGLVTVDYRQLYPERDVIEGLDPGDLDDYELHRLVMGAHPATLAALLFP